MKGAKRQRSLPPKRARKARSRTAWLVVGLFATALIVVLVLLYSSPDEPQDGGHFDGERALGTVEQLCAMGNRYSGASNRAEAIGSLRERLDALVDQTALQRFEITEKATGRGHELTNIIGRQAPELERRVIVASHWDTEASTDGSQPIMGANDGTSGVAVLLELARALGDHRSNLPVGVDYVLFDGHQLGSPDSDDSLQGSKYFARLLTSLYPRSRPELAIVVDMVGDCDQRLYPERSALQKSPRLVTRLWDLARDLGYGEHFALEGTRDVEADHSALQEVGIQSVLLVDYDYPHWHTQQDTIDKVCASSLERVGRVLEEFLLHRDE